MMFLFVATTCLHVTSSFMHKMYNGLVLAVVYMKLWKQLSANASKSNTRNDAK